MSNILLSGRHDKTATVDDGDFDWLNQWAWRYFRIDNQEYAVRTEESDGRRRLIFMHRQIMNAQPGEIVDHADGNGLNNIRGNLRIATASQNAANRKVLPAHKSSQYRGVHWDRRKRRWIAEIHACGRVRHLGYFSSEEAAAARYNEAAHAWFGEFAQLNVLIGSALDQEGSAA